ncbi:MAG: hypothetical protein PHW35_10900 [Lentimicrobiaceae bacterium]|nr:hypothetical protein [Lentimicrobiaceae bacterium]MDD4598463.1 hypothetical protein [Lentimicrobiaceae bacterium]MDY0025993.1 hypothetical protein [Lentimicrobium sp.]
MNKPMLRILFSMLLILPATELRAQPVSSAYWQLGGGITIQSFFGDLSVHDFNPGKKIKEESAPGFYFQFIRHLSPLFSAKIQFIHGRMKGANPESGFRFNTKFNELALLPRLNINHLISPRSTSRINTYVVAGVGIINFRARKFNLEDETPEASVGYDELGEKSGNAQNSFVFPLGMEVSFEINNNWALEAGYSMRLHNTDNIDAHIGSTNINDRYSVLHIGVIYAINKSQKNIIRQLDCPEGDGTSRVKKRGRLF